MALKRVQSGQPFEPDADEHNQIVEAVRYVEQLQRSGAGVPTADRAQPCVMPVKNTTGFDLNRFDVLGIDSVFPTPGDNLDAFKNGPLLHGTVPSIANHRNAWAILLEPAGPGVIVPGIVAGTTIAKVDVQSISHKYAGVKNGDTGALLSAFSASAAIVWSPGGLGVQWCVIRIGVEQPAESRICFRLTADLSIGGSAAAVILDGAGNVIGSTTVYDHPDGFFYGTTGTPGIASWQAERQRYEIDNLACEPGGHS